MQGTVSAGTINRGIQCDVNRILQIDVHNAQYQVLTSKTLPSLSFIFYNTVSYIPNSFWSVNVYYLLHEVLMVFRTASSHTANSMCPTATKYTCYNPHCRHIPPPYRYGNFALCGLNAVADDGSDINGDPYP
jgi:hypothetical protein